MKYLNYLNALVAVVLLAMGCACSSEEEPDLSFDGVINAEALDELVNGPCAFDCIEERQYRKSCEDYLNGTGEWVLQDEPTFGMSRNSDSNTSRIRWIISNGQLITPIIFVTTTSSTDMDLIYGWKIYCKQTGFDKTFAFENSITVDKENYALNSGRLIYKIHRVDDKYLAVSFDYPDRVLNENGEPIYGERAYKVEYLFKKASKPNMEKFKIVEGVPEAQLWMVKTMREYFGDTINVYEYTSQGDKDRIIDLVEIEYWINRRLKLQSDLNEGLREN